MDQFVVSSKGGEKDVKDGGGDIVMNEDGTMFVAGGEMEEEFE